ncbi:2-isopropylmalate synthase [Solihabitans fulvus]|uniref:2-isopropylmalate synthase n=2 Tax=Solihabitans fulvus TaxID=1892852 RepID=A0A5B2XK14_9PSEU|nr:2-isopropylmalate synthase [Solihabitans fulvus]
MREGGERALFGADDSRKLRLIEALADAGIRDIDLGSGLTEPAFLLRCLDSQKLLGRIPADTQFVFNLTLKTWEPLSEALRVIPREYLEKIQVSLGMVEYRSDENLLERAHDKLLSIGVGSFRASILNAFAHEIDDDRYEFINKQIARVRQRGIDLVRVNDSIGTLYPDATAVLAANLVRDNPDITFYLHSHDDRGLGLANSLASIFHGFAMVEGGVGGFGNRAGLANVEVLSQIFAERGITVAGAPLDTAKLSKAAALAEDVFMVLPNVYRPVSGMLVENENAGIVNVPDYLGVSRPVDYFLNPIGLFPDTVGQILANTGLPSEYLADEEFLAAVTNRLVTRMEHELYWEKRAKFDELLRQVTDFYTGIVRLEDVQTTALEVLQDKALRSAVGSRETARTAEER